MDSYYQDNIEKKNNENSNYNFKTEDNSFKQFFPNNHNYEISDEITNYEDIAKAQLEADKLLNEFDEHSITNNNLIFNKQSVSLLKIYKHFFEPIDWVFLFLAILGGIGAGVCQPIIFYLNSAVFSSIGNTSEEIISGPPQIVEMIKQLRKESIHKTMNKNVRKQLIFGAISFVSNFLLGAFWLLIGSRCAYNFKKKYFTLLLAQEQGWFDSFNTYELSTKVQAQIEQIEMGVGIRVGLVLTSVIQLIIGFIFAFVCCWKCALVMLSVTPVVIIIYFILDKCLRKGIILSRKVWENAGGIAEELIYNIKTVASFANFEYELGRFYEKVDIVWRLDLMNACKLAFSNGFVIFLLHSCTFLCFIYGRTLIGKDINYIKGRDTNGGDIFSTAISVYVGLQTINIIAPNLKGIQESCSAASDYFNLYNRQPLIDYSQSIERPPQIEGKIEFHGVNFYYPSDSEKKLILNGMELLFQPGKKVAIVGESGCGKSTIVNLIERLYDINEGQILIDGIEVNKYDIEYLRNNIGYVQQEPVLFNESIRKNIIFGREEYLSSIGNIDELVQNACDETYCSEFINNLSEGLDYIVGIKGSKLSGGQRQRIAIARAIVGKPKILILDEATSSLDNISEKEVQKSLDNISHNSITTIIIAHRLSTIKNADLIYVIKDGKVLEQGNHEELLKKGGYYSGLILSQLAQDEIETKYKKEEKLKEKATIRTENEKIKFEKRDNAIALSEQDVPIRPCAILTELHNYKLDIFLGCLGALISGCLWPITGFFMAKTINALNSRYETRRYDQGLKYSFVYLAFSFLHGLGNCLMFWKLNSLGSTLSRIYRKKLMAKYLSFHLSYFDVTKNSPGALLTKLSINTIELTLMLNAILGISIQSITIAITGLVIGLVHDYRLCLINFCFAPAIIISHIFRRLLIESQSRRSITANIEAGGILSECVMNTKTIFSFNFQKKAIQMYLEIIDYIRRQFVKDAIINGFFMGLGCFCYFAANAAVYGTAKYYLSDFSLSSEDMSIIMNVTNNTIQSLANIIANLGNLPKAFVAFRSIYSTLDTVSLIPPFRRDNISKLSANNIKGKIEFKNVYFAYPTRPENIILKDVSLTIMPGQNIGLVGTSGSGKSTIIQLINRFYDVEEGKGEILIDDINIKDYNLYELRKKIGLVSQEPSIFRTTNLENVRYGRLDANENECFEAAREANITKLLTQNKVNDIMKINKNIGDIEIDSDNENLMSGGEKQRICIARVFVKDPTILLLDEATSSLDKGAELEVQNSLDKLVNNRTCISISHRLNTVENCDQIYVMERGRIIETGTHKELLELKKVYYTLYKYSSMK